MTESNIKTPKQAVLYSITAPDEKQEARFKAFLAKKYGEEVELTWEKSDAFPGGFRLEIENEIYDWSVNGRFQQLRDTLTSVPKQNGNIIPLIKETIESWTPQTMAQEVGIVTTVGSSNSHKAVLENPDLISRTVLAKGLDNGTAFEILSIDIADVDIGRNIGAHLQIQQAEADKQIAQAKAEERRATAIAKEQEMRAEVEHMKAKVVEAEAEVPKAMAEALRSGNLGVMDYYKMQNVLADTAMKNNVGNTDLTKMFKDKEDTPTI